MHLATVTVPGPGPEPVWADALGPAPDPQAVRANAAAHTEVADTILSGCMSAGCKGGGLTAA